jgi:hypothetical protein
MLGSPSRDQAPTDKFLKTYVIPAFVTDWTKVAPEDASWIEEVTFAPGSTITEPGEEVFAAFVELRSICIAASITVIPSYCFRSESSGSASDQNESHLANLTFEPQSKLRTIAPRAFWGCSALRSIVLPDSVEEVTGESFTGCGLSQIAVPNNPRLESREGFLLHRQDRSVIRYFGVKTIVSVPLAVEILGESSFDGVQSLTQIRFKRGSKIRAIRACAFRGCSCLASIDIPPSVEGLGDEAFASCQSLTSVTFDPKATLIHIGTSAFDFCERLTSIDIPSSVTILTANCFNYCYKLAEVTFAGDSKLAHIEHGAFQKCYSLIKFTVPRSVRFIGERCFAGCSSLTTITFSQESDLIRIEYGAFEGCFALVNFLVPANVELIGMRCFDGCSGLLDWTLPSPCRIWELSLPPIWRGPHSDTVPESVEILSVSVSGSDMNGYTLNFGRDSKLQQIRHYSASSNTDDRPAVLGRSFLQLSSRNLRMFRANLEFDSSG